MKKIDFKKLQKKIKTGELEKDLKKTAENLFEKGKVIYKEIKEGIKSGEPKKNYIITLVVIVVAGLILARTIGTIHNVLFAREAKKQAELELIGEAVPVKVYKIKKMAFKDTLPAMGTIKGFKEIGLKFETSGILESFNFEEGERIQEGDIIANLNQKDALLKLKYAELELNKNQRLFDAGGIDKIKLEQTKLEYESAKSDFEKTNIYAIADGILGSRDIDVGTYINANENVKIGTFIEIGNVYAEFDIIERDAPKLKLGQKTEIYVDAFPTESFTGTIDSISPIIEGKTRTQNIKIELKNKEFNLKPGMFTRTLIATYENDSALIIPTSAFKKKENEYFVYVVHPIEPDEKERKKKGEKEPVLEQGAVEVRKIKIAYLTQDAAEISEGLEEGELIIVDVFQEFSDKDRVEITEVQETIF
ncbi:MAG: efflux RND transporter periplasmic adaptor subunit [Candidatus Omnitrophica bacterium]|nr:efflux RND transporter periplasmic adaptor subunit [Candidatus Omnitrophota bacterium]